MPIPSFTISEVRVAATCPRISYFDAVKTRRQGLKAKSITRVWKAGDVETACGSMFHHAIESFNRQALNAPEVRDALEGTPDPRAIERGLRVFLNRRCVNLDALAGKPPEQQLAFIRAVEIYMGELADIVGDALARGKSAVEILDQLFGDRRRRVDVTFQVGPEGEPVHVTGILDYVFHDWRTTNHRIIDYKLTPSGAPTNDLFQVSLYALMHHIQHRTEPDVGVLYLHPDRTMATLTWEQVAGQRHKLFNLLASMAGWVRYDEATGLGLKPPGEPSYCPHCKWDKDGQCLSRLGPKHEGSRLRHWGETVAFGPEADGPPTAVRAVDRPSRAWAEPEDSSSESPTHDESGPVTVANDLEEVGTGPAAIDWPISPPAADALRIGATIDRGRAVGLPLADLPTHLAVVGAAGSGKTWMAKVIAEEAICQGVPVLAIDPQGDLVQFLRPGVEPPGLSADDRALRQAFLDRVEPRIWTPGSSHGQRLSLDPVRLAGRDELARINDPARRLEEWEGMLEIAAGHLVGLAKVGGEEDSQRTFLLQILRGLTRAASGADVGLARVAAAVADPMSVGLDDPERFVRKSEREKLARKLNALLHGPSARLYSGGCRLDLDAFRQSEVPGKTPLNVVYLNALADDDQKQFFVAALAAEIYRWMITSLDATGGPNLLFYLDEARDYLPAGSAKPPAKPPLLRLFAQGRKYGVACLICTQSPRSVDYNAFSNCSTKLIGRLESAQDVERVADWFGTTEGAPPWLAGRKGAAAGSFVARWPGMPPDLEGRAFRSRPLFSLHEGAWSPDRLEREMANGSGSRGNTA
ncbi:MAG: PD-(D/E)XK nuclease family protein [Isosphaeraceae bacterium]